MHVLAIPGSLRAQSLNARLLRHVAEQAPDGVGIELYEQARMKAIPPYDEDDDGEPAPEAVAELRDEIDRADGVLIATPEYNASVPGVLKNAIDWASRPEETTVLRNKPIAVTGASTGRFGGVWAQQDLRKILRIAGARVVATEHAVAQAHTHFDEEGRLTATNHRVGLLLVLDDLLAEIERDRELVPA
jgi:chromate reductase, NAD(P)H dehydrogenase (quinone)